MLFTGRGTSGSWLIRGQQLGTAVGATVQANATDIADHRLAVVVKRCPTDLLLRLHKAKMKLVWDVLDSYPQPLGNEWSRKQCMGWLRDNMTRMKPHGIVAATKAMAEDCKEFGVPVLYLPHHAWPGKPINPIRQDVRIVAYQGGPHYLGEWQWFMNAECQRRGWTFHVNRGDLADADIAIAVRQAKGYAPLHWKSGCKLANCQGSGTPVILNRERGCLEMACSAERWADTQAEMAEAFDYLTDHDRRAAASVAMLAAAPKLDDIAQTYREWLSSF